MMKITWLYREETDWDLDENPIEWRWVFKEKYDEWRPGEWKRIVYCEVENE